MHSRSTWTPARIVFAILTLVAIVFLGYGVFMLILGGHFLNASQHSTQPEDASPIAGLLAGFIGLAISAVGVIGTLVFGALYIFATRRSRQRPVTSPGPTIINPAK